MARVLRKRKQDSKEALLFNRLFGIKRLTLLLAWGATVCLSRAQATFATIPSTAHVVGMSRDGNYLIGSLANNMPFLWSSSSGIVSIPFPPIGVSNNGVVVGISGTSSNRATRWTAAQGSQDLGVLPGTDNSGAYGVSDDGSVITGFSGKSVFRWTSQNGMESLGTGAGTSLTNGLACSSDGAVIVGAFEGVPFRWTSGTGLVKELPFNGYYAAVSSDGSVAEGHVKTPFFTNEGVANKSGNPLYIGTSSFPSLVEPRFADDLSFGFATSNSGGVLNAMIWRPGEGLTRLKDFLVANGAASAGTVARIVNAIVSADGTAIGGTAIDSNGNFVGFHGTITISAPTGSLLSGLAVSPNPRVGSNDVSVLAQLSGSAPAGGAKIPLISSSSLLTPKSTALVGGPGIYVPAGATTAPNSSSTAPTGTFQTVYVRGSLAGISRIAPLVLQPATLYDPTLSSNITTGGSVVKCTVKLNGLPASTATINVSSSDTAAATVPSTVTIGTNSLSNQFNIQTHPVVVPTLVTISVTYRGITKTTTLTVLP